MQGLSQPFKIKTFEVGPMQNLIYVIWDIETKLTALIDPAWDLTNVNSFIKRIKNTHIFLRKWDVNSETNSSCLIYNLTYTSNISLNFLTSLISLIYLDTFIY